MPWLMIFYVSICLKIKSWKEYGTPDQFTLALGLHTNWRSCLISFTESNFECLQRKESVSTWGSIYWHLGYPLGVDVVNVQLIYWIGNDLKGRFMYWKSQLWSFHIDFKVVQCIVNHDTHAIVFFYHYSLGLRRLYKHCSNHLGTCCGGREKIWELRDLMGPFDYSQTVRWCGKILFWKRISWFIDLHYYKTCIDKLNHGYLFIEHDGLVHGKTKIQASWWSLLNHAFF